MLLDQLDYDFRPVNQREFHEDWTIRFFTGRIVEDLEKELGKKYEVRKTYTVSWEKMDELHRWINEMKVYKGLWG